MGIKVTDKNHRVFKVIYHVEENGYAFMISLLPNHKRNRNIRKKGGTGTLNPSKLNIPKKEGKKKKKLL